MSDAAPAAQPAAGPVAPREVLEADARRLRADFARMCRALEDYRRSLAEPNGDAEWAALVVDRLRAQHLALLQSRVSVGSVELACALLRHVLRRLNLDVLRFTVRADAATDIESKAAPEAEAESPAVLLAALHAAARAAPLELRECLRRVLLGVDDLLEALAEDSAENVHGALVRLNLATSTAQSRGLLREIALVARTAYDSLGSVAEALPLDELSQRTGGIAQAAERLHSVLTRLDDAATQNLDLLEGLNRLADEERARLGSVLEALRAAQHRLMVLRAEHPALAPAAERLQQRLSDEVGAPAMSVQLLLEQATAQHMELISDQSFQELSGRTLRKIIEFVKLLDSQLYEILKPYGTLRDRPPPAAPDASSATVSAPGSGDSGPQQSQADVDKLLGELGF